MGQAISVDTGLGEGELLERDGPSALLEQALGDVRGGHGRLVLVSGEAGIGKSALIRRFCVSCASGARLLQGSCDGLRTPRPLGPLVDIGAVTGGRLQEVTAAGGKPHLVFDVLLDQLRSEPVSVVVLEDAHWADEATLDLLGLLGRRIGQSGALVIATYRNDELARTHPLRMVLGDLSNVAGVERIQLERLSPAAVAELAAPYGADPAELYAKTGGNPFFVTEALASGSEEVPPTIRDAVLAHAARLDAGARELLDAVAVVPQRTELWLLEALAGEMGSSLDDCLTSGMLRAEEHAVAFRHELARIAIEESINPHRRISLHRAALHALSHSPSGGRDLARLAHHAEAAGDGEAVLRFAPAAAEHAASLGAHREAEAQYARALRFASGQPPEARADLLERFANEGYLTDMRNEAVEALEEALAIHRERGDLRKQGEVLRLQARLLVCPGRNVEARAAAREAVAVLEQLPPGRELTRAYGALAHVCMLADEHEETIAWGSRAIELAERLGDTEALVHVLNSVGSVEAGLGVPEGREKLERSLELAEQAGLGPDTGRAYINLGSILGRRREWLLADRYIGPGIEYCREHGLEAWSSCLVGLRAESELARGRWTDAAETAMSILNRPASQVVSPRMAALLVLALVRARRGDPGYGPLLEEALALAESSGDLQMVAPVAAARAEALWLEGKGEAVAEETQAAFELALVRRDPWFLGELACWRRRAGLVVELEAGVGEPYELQLAGDWAGTAERWTELGCPYEAALALADADDEEALRRSFEELQRLGAQPAAAIVARRLRGRGARGVPRGPRPTTRQNPAQLTRRELEVLGHVAQGLRNADIAERLFLAEKTVDHHVSAILRKLQVRTRGEAGAEAVRLGLTG